MVSKAIKAGVTGLEKLTKKVVDAANPRAKQYTIWCGQLKGFGVCINPSGTRSYVADYRNDNGVRRRMTIGRHGVLTAEEARKMALAILGSTVMGEDPQQERKTRRSSLTVAQLCDQYLAEADKGLIFGKGGRPKKASTLATDKGRIKRHIKPLLGRKLVIDLKRSDIAKFIRDVTAGKTAKTKPSKKLRGLVSVSGGPGAAARTTGLLGGMLSYAVSEDIIETNPVIGVKKPAGQKRDRRLTAPEYRALGKAFDEAEIQLKSWQAIGIIKMVALTGCRLGEVENLKWHEVDLEAQVLRLEDSKTGKSIRPLGKPVIDLLSALEREYDTPYVFPALRINRKPYGGIMRFYRWLFKEAGLNGVTPHVLRHSFASVGADLGFTDSTIGACLGHSGSGITSRYTHRLDSVLIAAADKISIEISGQIKLQNRICHPNYSNN